MIKTREAILPIEDIIILGNGLSEIAKTTKMDAKVSYTLGRLHDKVERITSKFQKTQQKLYTDDYSEVVGGKTVPIYKKHIEYMKKVYELSRVEELLKLPILTIDSFVPAEIEFGTYVMLEKLLKKPPKSKKNAAVKNRRSVICTNSDIGKAVDGVKTAYKKVVEKETLSGLLEITVAILQNARSYYNETNSINWEYTEIGDENRQTVTADKREEYEASIDTCNDRPVEIEVPHIGLEAFEGMDLPPLFYSGMGIFLDIKD